MPLKRKWTAMGTRAPHMLSIVDGFSQQPSLEFAAGSVAPIICLLALARARASPAASGEDAQSGNRRATTPDERAGAETAVPSPRCDEPAPLSHGGWSNSPAR